MIINKFAWPVPYIAWDNALFKLINSHHSAVFDVIFWSCSTFGSGWGIIPAYLLFIILKAPKTRLWFILTVSAATLIAGGLLNTTMKEKVDRYRPTIYFVSPSASPPPPEAARSFEVHNIGPRYRDHSFPSGHTWTACAISVLMILFFGRKYWWAFLIAAAIGYSRIYVGVHFPSDVVVGGSLGSLLAFFVWRVAVWIAPRHARPHSREGG